MAVVELEHPFADIALLRLNRPDRMNAINFDLVADLHSKLDDIALDDGCKVIILTGSERAFCSGLDLKDWGELPAIGTHAHRHAGSTGQSFMSSLTTHLRDTPQIVIASVNGPAYGGGMALSLACDLPRRLGLSIVLCCVHPDRAHWNRHWHQLLLAAAHRCCPCVRPHGDRPRHRRRASHADGYRLPALRGRRAPRTDPRDGARNRQLYRSRPPHDKRGHVGEPRRTESPCMSCPREPQPGPGWCESRSPGVHAELSKSDGIPQVGRDFDSITTLFHCAMLATPTGGRVVPPAPW